MNDELRDESEDATSKRKREVAQEIQRQRQARRQKKTDVASGLVTMGEVLAKGLVDAANIQFAKDTTNKADSTTDRALTAVIENLEQAKVMNAAILASIAKTNATNEAILQLLQKQQWAFQR
ncbi:hypothetical protein AC1031_000899 [Aphanomyces cochlioides]|nr:hypothetical protein AC1031_000899 [Aphanomyces cochlioides]